ncbi:MAG: tRNA (N(6)-L-threonylcarbamoyladenosine(37)-C(2))-methylthiotransferase MtaB, partial [Clostridia bacterium]|nr:tRNA (N(6)-L-threonylcarbamoyladenosine(37)-C(2))-methylthiotransferase MtaB [Clostridia bacterium]
LPSEVSECEKTKRAALMGEAAKAAEKAFLETQVGRREKVLFEEGAEGFFEGYTENYTRVKVTSQKDISGEILSVLITSAADDYCIGEI